MNYDDPRLRALLAGEYVLGTLRGRARRRFERLLLEDPALRQRVEDWDMKLNLMVTSIPPLRPPERVWRAIRARIAPARTEAPGWWNPLALWRALAAAALLTGVVLGIQLARPPALETPPARVAVLTGAQGQPAWIVAVVAKPGEAPSLRFTALKPQTLSPEKSFELWLIPGDEGVPISAGLLPPTGRGVHVLSPSAQQALNNARALAVSLEPKGGSPTGAPTGPVLFQGLLVAM